MKHLIVILFSVFFSFKSNCQLDSIENGPLISYFEFNGDNQYEEFSGPYSSNYFIPSYNHFKIKTEIIINNTDRFITLVSKSKCGSSLDAGFTLGIRNKKIIFSYSKSGLCIENTIISTKEDIIKFDEKTKIEFEFNYGIITISVNDKILELDIQGELYKDIYNSKAPLIIGASVNDNGETINYFKGKIYNLEIIEILENFQSSIKNTNVYSKNLIILNPEIQNKFSPIVYSYGINRKEDKNVSNYKIIKLN